MNNRHVTKSKYFASCLEYLYNILPNDFKCNLTYQDVIKNNESRMRFITLLLDLANDNKLPLYIRVVLNRYMYSLICFVDGKDKSDITVPQKYYADFENNVIVPSKEELEFLFENIKTVYNIFLSEYEGKDLFLSMPDGTIDQNKEYRINIKKRNLAHLLGLTESSLGDKPNALFKYYIEEYGSSLSTTSSFLDWIMSKNGKEEIINCNNEVLEYLEIDKKKNKYSYDNEGNMKPNHHKTFELGYIDYIYKKYYSSFKKEDVIETIKVKYPILKYSRYITHTINLINFLNQSNTYSCIADYNALDNDNLKQDFWIINGDINRISHNNNLYNSFYVKCLENIYNYLNGSKESFDWLIKYQVKIGYGGVLDIPDAVKDYCNRNKARKFLSGIKVSNQEVDEFIYKLAIKNGIPPIIHMIGNTSIEPDKYDLDKTVNIDTHTDTSISITSGEFISKYRRLGNMYFIDKILEDSSVKNIKRLSTVLEEMDYYTFIEFDEKHVKSLKRNQNIMHRRYRHFKLCNDRGLVVSRRDYEYLYDLVELAKEQGLIEFSNNGICIYDENKQNVILTISYEDKQTCEFINNILNKGRKK